MINYATSRGSHTHRSPRGFTLLIAVILTTVVLSIALSLLDVTYKQVILASTARQSATAFYAADSALECAIYYDQKQGTFDFDTELPSGTITCQGQTVNYTSNLNQESPPSRTTVISIPCASDPNNSQATTTLYKQSTGATTLYALGFSSCNSASTNRSERGVKATY